LQSFIIPGKKIADKEKKKKGNELHQKRKHPNCVNWNNRLEKQRKKQTRF